MKPRWSALAWAIGGALWMARPAIAAAADDSTWIEPFARLTSPAYRRAVAERDRLRAELARLPETPQFQQSGQLGFEITNFLRPRRDGRLEGWIDVDLGQPTALDAIVLVPVDTPWRDYPGVGYGFPLRFKVEADDGRQLRTIADYTAADFPNPGELPVWLPAAGAGVKRVRITMTKPCRYGPAFSVLAMGEIMLIRGNRNLGAGLPPEAVKVSESFESLHVWSKDNLIDGLSVLGAPVGADRSAAQGYHSAIADRADAVKWVQVDLGASLALDEVRLIGCSATQLAGRPGFGFPVRFKVELADEPGFTAPRLLCDHTAADFPNPAANPVTVVANGARGRFVRVTATKLWERGRDFVFALSELQAYAGGRNVAQGQPVTAFDSYNLLPRETAAPADRSAPGGRLWAPKFLTDGFTGERRLIEWPEFLRGLSRRREALAELAVVETAAGETRRSAVTRLGRAAIAGGFIGVIAVLFLVQRARDARQRDLERLRQQIASDLHDEIGSNLGSIALLSEMGLRRNGDNAHGDLEEIRAVARQTADSMRDIVGLLQRPAVAGSDCVVKLREIAARMLAGLDWTFAIHAQLELPSLFAQRHLLLAFKEALHNVRKHARAQRVTIALEQDGPWLCLRIVDDGVGFDPTRASTGHGLASLRHRASALGGRIAIASRPGAGTTLSLFFHPGALHATAHR